MPWWRKLFLHLGFTQFSDVNSFIAAAQQLGCTLKSADLLSVTTRFGVSIEAPPDVYERAELLADAVNGSPIRVYVVMWAESDSGRKVQLKRLFAFGVGKISDRERTAIRARFDECVLAVLGELGQDKLPSTSKWLNASVSY